MVEEVIPKNYLKEWMLMKNFVLAIEYLITESPCQNAVAYIVKNNRLSNLNRKF